MAATLVLNPTVDITQKPLWYDLDELANITNTKTTKTFYISRSFVEISYKQGNGAAATGKFLYVVFNAVNSLDSDIRLPLKGLRFPIELGETRAFVFPASALCTTIDLIADTAETGTSKTIITAGA